MTDYLLKNACSASFVERSGFSPDLFQLKAFQAIDMDRSVLVAAPTGSGKTLVAQYGVDRCFSLGLRAFYTTPLKALSNQKFQEFVELYGETRVGLLTGDNAINPGAEVVIMTTEVLRNMLYEGSSDLSKLGQVILDEVHYLQNPYRGAVWEEVIIHLPAHVSLICLSATVSNAHEFGDWIRTVRGPTDVVVETTRPVELIHKYGVATSRGNDFVVFDAIVEDRPNVECAKYDDPRSQGVIVRRQFRHNLGTPRRIDVLDYLKDAQMLPAVFFIFSRQGCEAAVEQMIRAQVRLTSATERTQIRAIVDDSITNLSTKDLEALGFSKFLAGLEAGVASHHAGMVPPLKEAVEKCFSKSLVKVVFATETLSLGINMPARSVIIEKLNKFNGDTHELLTPGEYTQLAGRAGRRGIDEIGYCLALWSPYVAFSQVANLMMTKSYPLTSSFRPTYNMAANLVRSFEPQVARNLLNLSFAQFRSDAEIVHLEARLAKLRGERESLVEQTICSYGDVQNYYNMTLQKVKASKTVDAVPPERLIIPYFAKLRPGDVLVVPSEENFDTPTRVVVVATSKKKGGRVSVWVLTSSGQKLLIRANQVDFIPKPVARIDLGLPYDPKEHTYLNGMSERLRGLMLADVSFAEPRFSRSNEQHVHVRQANESIIKLRNELRVCPDFNQHLAAVKKLARLGEMSNTITATVKSHSESLARQFDRVLEVLTNLGFVDGWKLTKKGERLAGLFHESDLLIALCLEQGLFDDLEASDLVALLSIFVYESRVSAPGSDKFPSRDLEYRFSVIAHLRTDLIKAEARMRIPSTKVVESGFMVYASAWAKGKDLSVVIGDHNVPGGDFVRYIKQIIDLSRQLANVVTDPTLAQRFRSINALICRGVVEASIKVN